MVLIWALAALPMAWTPIQIGYMIVTIIGGMFLFSGLFILGSGVSF